MRNGCCKGGGSTKKAFAWDEYIYPALWSMLQCGFWWYPRGVGMVKKGGGDVAPPFTCDECGCLLENSLSMAAERRGAWW